MQTLKQQLKANKLKNLYLFYGKEHYLKNIYKHRFKHRLLGSEEDMMNYHYFEGKQLEVNALIDLAETMPFLREERVLILENTELFKSGKKEASDKMADYLKALPATTYMVFIEEDVDKRNKLYKAVKAYGQVVEFNQANESEIKEWLYRLAKKNNKTIGQEELNYFIDRVGLDMTTLEKEFEKLLSYCLHEVSLTKEAIDAICSNQLENKIFEMMDAISVKNQPKALTLYHDLLTLKEPPLRVLYMLVRQFRMLLQIKLLDHSKVSAYQISQQLNLRKFIVDRCMRQIKNFTVQQLKDALYDCLDYEALIKTGRIQDQLAVELIIVKYSMKSVV